MLNCYKNEAGTRHWRPAVVAASIDMRVSRPVQRCRRWTWGHVERASRTRPRWEQASCRRASPLRAPAPVLSCERGCRPGRSPDATVASAGRRRTVLASPCRGCSVRWADVRTPVSTPSPRQSAPSSGCLCGDTADRPGSPPSAHWFAPLNSAHINVIDTAASDNQNEQNHTR